MEKSTNTTSSIWDCEFCHKTVKFTDWGWWKFKPYHKKCFRKKVEETDKSNFSMRKLLNECISILEKTPPNYFDYGVEKLWSNACQHKILLLEQLKKNIKEIK